MRKCNLFFVLAFLSVVNVQFQTEPSGLFNIHDSLSWLIYSCLLKDCIILYLSTHSEEERHFGKPWVAQAFHYYINNSPLSSSYGDMTIAILTVCNLLPLGYGNLPRGVHHYGFYSCHVGTKQDEVVRERKCPVLSFVHCRTMFS